MSQKKIGMVLRDQHHTENTLARELLKVADRHRTDHEVFHVGRDLAGWSHTHVQHLAGMGQRYGVNLSRHEKFETRLTSAARRKVAAQIGQRAAPAMLLLSDLRKLHRMATEASLNWELLGQAAQATKDVELLELTKLCHPQTLRQMRWTNKLVKELSPQALST